MAERESMYFPAGQLQTWMLRDPQNLGQPGPPPAPTMNGTSNGNGPLTPQGKLFRLLASFEPLEGDLTIIFHWLGFRIDADISQNVKPSAGRQLQAWADDVPPSNGSTAPNGRGDDITFGSVSGPWDQFAVNQQKFGLTTDFDEEVYTTKLDRSRPDFKERERRAVRIASEIEGVRDILQAKYH